MRSISPRTVVLSALCGVALQLQAAGMPVPPIKMGLWEVKSSVLDADGKPQVPPEQAAMANMSPEIRARMAEMMKARGLSMPDQSGALKLCQTKESMESGQWQAMAANAGCTSDFSTRTSSSWKFHSSCPKLKSESDGEVVFSNPENYTTKITTTSSISGTAQKQTRVMVSHWLGANCGDVKPFTPENLKAR